MPRKKIGASVVLFDANSSSSFKERAIDCYRKICERMHFTDDENITKLFLTNVEGKKHATNYVPYNACNRIHLQSAKGVLGDWLSDLEDVVDNLHYVFEKKENTRFQVLVLSDLTTPSKLPKEEINEKIEKIVETLKEYEGYIYFLGVNLQPEKLLNNTVDVYKWVQLILKDTVDLYNTQGENTDHENINYSIAARITKDAMGIMCDFDIGTDLFLSYVEGEKAMTSFIVPLTFNDELELPTRVTKFMDPTSSDTPRIDNLRINEKFVLLEEQDVEVPREDTQPAMIIHEKLITFPKDVSKGLQDYERFFKLLGFTDSKNVPSHYMINESADILTSNDADIEIGVINHLVEACIKHDKYGIAVRAYMKNTMPKLYCLIPKQNPPHFLMVEIPYAEDFVLPYNEDDVKKFKVESHSTKEVFGYLDSINLDDKIKIHPNLRLSDTKKRLAEMNQDLREGNPIKQTPLVPFDIEFKSEQDLLSTLEKKYDVKEEELEDLW
ncbi:uncharacterized protein [Onthophagus taurus]|uniref:uncharacterized protein n=1 Tax=Onthophagus taurus TaxID=166361 RepID=UPI000C203D31|nr:uncharacterized protein LOC111416200 [Onthophagus taurus]